MKVNACFVAACEVGNALGLRAISKTEGLTEFEIDASWSAKINPHDSVVGGVPSHCVSIEFNGWPAGIFDAGGGVLAAGELANERTFLAACRKKIRSLGGVPTKHEPKKRDVSMRRQLPLEK